MDPSSERAISVSGEEKISALLDDELSEFEFAAVLREVERDPALRAVWARYHLIRGSMRRELAQIAPVGLAERIAQSVAMEVPARRRSMGIGGSGWPILKTVSGLAIAASVAAVAILAVRPSFLSEPAAVTAALQSKPSPSPAVAMSDASPKAVASARDSALNAMLVKHGEYSPAVGMSGLAPYVRVVGHPGNR